MHVSGADEAAGVIAFGLFGFVVYEAGSAELGAHARTASQNGCVDAGNIHHADVFVQIEQHPVRDKTGGPILIVGQRPFVARILFKKFPRHKMMLKVDDLGPVSHLDPYCRLCSAGAMARKCWSHEARKSRPALSGTASERGLSPRFINWSPSPS